MKFGDKLLVLERINDIMKLWLGDKLIWEGSLGEWSRILASASVRLIKETA